MSSIKVINFYRFTPLGDELSQWQMRLSSELSNFDVLGTILLAPEGLNGSLAGSPSSVDEAFSAITSLPPFAGMSFRSSYGSTQPYRKLIVRKKRQILAFPKQLDPNIDEILAGPALNPEQWAEILDDKPEDLVILDTRNHYEFEVGSFEGAEHLEIEQFRDFPMRFSERYQGQEDKTFLMFCTGGIRCEKALAYARSQGFQKAYKLDGGIIDYLQEKGSKYWNGECFVFDQRWTVQESLDEGTLLNQKKKQTEV